MTISPFIPRILDKDNPKAGNFIEESQSLLPGTRVSEKEWLEKASVKPNPIIGIGYLRLNLTKSRRLSLRSAGGDLLNPTYRNHKGHQEAVIVTFDPAKISYKKLLRGYWRNIDPLDGDGYAFFYK